MKKLTSIFLALCLLTILCLPANATAARLTDEADLLTASEAAALEAKLDEISTRQGVDIVIVTVESTYGEEPRDFADDWFDYNDYGLDGILLLVSMEDNDWYVSTSGYGITAITDAGLEYISDKFVPHLSDEEYMEAFETFADLCDSFITQAKTGDPYNSHNLPKEPFNVVLNLLICLGIGLVVALIVTGKMRSDLVTVRQQVKADNYVIPGSLQLTNSRDLFLYSQVTKIERPKSGGSSTHTSSSGRTHGGGGGKF